MSRTSWHLRTGGVVAAWLAAVVLVALIHRFLPVSGWLLVHLLGLGAAGNAILIWSWHFATALLKLPDDVMRRGQGSRLGVFNAGAVAVVAGVVAGNWPVVLAGGAAVAAVACWHAIALLRRMRAALPSRFGATVRFYIAAGAALPVGVTLGVLMARGGLTAEAHARVVVAHAVLNLLGWIGLTVVGTLVTLWPTMLRTRIAEGSQRTATRMLWVLVAGLVVAAGGALAGSGVLAAAGLLLYLGGLVAMAVPHVEEVRRKAPVEFSTASVLAGVTWLAGSLVWLAAVLATTRDGSAVAEHVDSLTTPLLAGFAAQVLLGALTYLVPVVLGGGPTTVRATSSTLETAGPARVAATNAGLLLYVLPVPSLVRVLVSVVVLVAMASFLPLLVRAVLVARARRDEPARPAGPPPRVPSRRRAGVAAVGLSAVMLAAAGGVALDPAAAGVAQGPPANGGVAATGQTTTVQVRIEGMRFVPGVVEVPSGNRLVVVLRNTGDNTHDLVLESLARTPRIRPGEQATLDAGVVGRDLEGWCSVAGHRQLGMVLNVNVVGGEGQSSDHDTGHLADPAADDATDRAADADGAAADPARTPDLAAVPGPGFTARDPRLPPSPDADLHELTLRVREVEREVTPGFTQRLWTFNGTAPGPTLRGKVGDVFDITLVNDGSMGHSIDFHAGALAPDRPMRTIQPGQSLTYRFTATRAGVWLYHCSTMPMSLHIANGMFGAVIIDPPGLPAVDREYVLVQSQLYLGRRGDVADADKLAARQPDLVVFNGYANQYDHDPLRAKVGERVRLWVLAAGPQSGTAFHVVGGQFDTVWKEGGYLLRAGPGGDTGAQVLDLAPAQGGFVELTFPQAGHYPFVTHAMVDAERGAHGVVQVDQRLR
ncbi:putative multicopper oxidase [Saccharomonospora marina XMU15]|uniref:Copper-containing nitrite reductase n=1 Tax=Saccharomonospora marina XMU15 TaxID=882083 RepID=H5WXY4_9PSEU|nr:multicopper oxidase domain-containing protein [Saccharomonospora marina]EHR52851.1 putative multicopper oxidase [Saccharomonospora marina XMU15]